MPAFKEAPGFSRGEHVTDDPRREMPITIKWTDDGAKIGAITINGEFWAAVEWSEKRQAWCIEDAAGRCLTHKASIHGQAASREAAEALAREMIRDGRIPTPEEAAAAHELRERQRREGLLARRAKRNQQPAQKRKREERQRRDYAWSAALSAKYETERLDQQQQPLLEALDGVFDFSDPELWKSNSWAALRPRLIVHQRAVLARLESELAYEIKQANTEPFAMYASNENRQRQREWRQQSANVQISRLQPQLDRARKIMRALEPEHDPNREAEAADRDRRTRPPKPGEN